MSIFRIDGGLFISHSIVPYSDVWNANVRVARELPRTEQLELSNSLKKNRTDIYSTGMMCVLV